MACIVTTGTLVCLLKLNHFERAGQGQQACVNLLAQRVALRQNECLLSEELLLREQDRCHASLLS